MTRMVSKLAAFFIIIKDYKLWPYTCPDISSESFILVIRRVKGILEENCIIWPVKVEITLIAYLTLRHKIKQNGDV